MTYEDLIADMNVAKLRASDDLKVADVYRSDGAYVSMGRRLLTAAAWASLAGYLKQAGMMRVEPDITTADQALLSILKEEFPNVTEGSTVVTDLKQRVKELEDDNKTLRQQVDAMQPKL